MSRLCKIARLQGLAYIGLAATVTGRVLRHCHPGQYLEPKRARDTAERRVIARYQILHNINVRCIHVIRSGPIGYTMGVSPGSTPIAEVYTDRHQQNCHKTVIAHVDYLIVTQLYNSTKPALRNSVVRHGRLRSSPSSCNLIFPYWSTADVFDLRFALPYNLRLWSSDV